MSHLQHINTFKVELISKGVTHPEDQMGLTRTAYTCAFIRFFTGKCVPDCEHKPVMEYMLGYWNETFPVNGPFVIGSVRSFFLRLSGELTQAKGMVSVPVSKEKVIDVYPEYSTLVSYEALVKTLVLEIEHKYPHIKKGA